MPIDSIQSAPVDDKAAPLSTTPIVPSAANSIYTCPMHPEVEQDHPGTCPKCGMALERKMVTAGTDDEESAELRDMTRRFWIGAVLALPVFILAMAHLIPALGRLPWVNSDTSRWIQFVLATPVVWWAGWPLLDRGWRSIASALTRNDPTLLAKSDPEPPGAGGTFDARKESFLPGQDRCEPALAGTPAF